MMCSLSALQTELEGLPAHIVEDAILQARIRADELRERERWRALIAEGSDQEIIAAGQEYARSEAVELARTYGHVNRWQELVAWADHASPRRPVMMRGSKEALCAIHSLSEHISSANGLALEVFDRVMRREKVIALSYEEYSEAAGPLRARLRERYRLTSTFEKQTRGWFADFSGGFVMIGGRWRTLTPSELSNIKGLKAIIARTEKLEDRAKAAKLHWKERMAA